MLFNGIYSKINEVIELIYRLKEDSTYRVAREIKIDRLETLLYQDKKRLQSMIDFLKEQGYTVFKTV